MNQIEYLIYHCIPTGWQVIGSTFRIWRDLMTNNYNDYTILHTEDPFEECKEWFWATLGADEVLSKDFLEYLRELMRRIDTGEEKLIPVNFEKLLSIEKMLEGLEDGDV